MDRVPRHVVWLALRKLGVEKWLAKIVQSMYRMLYVDYLALVTNTLEGLKGKLEHPNGAFES